MPIAAHIIFVIYATNAAFAATVDRGHQSQETNQDECRAAVPCRCERRQPCPHAHVEVAAADVVAEVVIVAFLLI